MNRERLLFVGVLGIIALWAFVLREKPDLAATPKSKSATMLEVTDRSSIVIVLCCFNVLLLICLLLYWAACACAAAPNASSTCMSSTALRENRA